MTNHMDNNDKSFCLTERLSKTAISLILLLMALVSVALGVTILPLFGFIIALPLAFFSWFFFRSHLNDQCEISGE